MKYPHGTASAYNHDACRCPDCRAANNEANRARHARGYRRPRDRPPVVVRPPIIPPPVRSYGPRYDALIAAAAMSAVPTL